MSLNSQLRSVIQWTQPDPETLFQRWTENGDEIKNASKLIVGPGQGCIFVYEGQVKATYAQEGMLSLDSANVPFWTTITKLMQGFESEHKVGIFFFRRAHLLNQRWGTIAPIKYDDPKYRFPVGLRAFGNYSIRITEPEPFFKNVVAGADFYGTRELREVFLSRITQPLTDLLANAKFSYAEIDSNRNQLSGALLAQLGPVFSSLGFEILDLRIEGTTFDEATEGRIGRIADLSAEAQAAAAAGIDYVTLQKLNALRDAARNEGGAGLGMAVGAGLGLGQAMAGMTPPQAVAPVPSPYGAPPPQTAAANPDDPLVKLEKLKAMLEKGFITADEYQAKKNEILSKM